MHQATGSLICAMMPSPSLHWAPDSKQVDQRITIPALRLAWQDDGDILVPPLSTQQRAGVPVASRHAACTRPLEFGRLGSRLHPHNKHSLIRFRIIGTPALLVVRPAPRYN
jgi:hypothetical protein